MRVGCGFKGHERNASIFIGFPLQMARNQFASNRTWVRIPSSPPKKSSKLKGLLDFPFFVRLLEFSDFRVRTALELAVFALEQRVFLVKSLGSNPVLLFSPARLHFPSGSRNHLTSEEAFPAPWPAPRIFWICSRDGHKYWRSC